MSIALVYLITDLELGGTPLVLRDRARGIRDRGEFVPTVVSLARPGPVGEMLEKEGIRVIGLGARGVLDFPRVLARWVRVLEEIRPAIVESLLVHANMVAVLGRPLAPPAIYIQEVHTTQARPHWHWWLQGIAAGRCDALIAPSHAVLDTLAHFGSAQRQIVIPNGVDIGRFRDAVVIRAQERPWPSDAWVVGYVGRLDPVKRLDLLLDAMSILIRANGTGDLHLAVVGYGEEESRLKKQVQALGITPNVHFCGPTTTPEIWYKAFDLLCLPSWSEGFGMTLIEAMAAGIPIVAASTAGVREVVRPNIDGVLIESQTAESLVSAIKEVINNREASRRRVAAGNEWVERFSLEREVEAHCKILKKFLRK